MKNGKKVPRAYEDLVSQISETVETRCTDPHCFGVIVEGEDMAPKVLPNDRAIFAPNTPLEDGDIAIVKLKDGRVVLRRYFCIKRTVHLRAENPKVEHLKVRKSQVAFAFPMFEIVRKPEYRPVQTG